MHIKGVKQCTEMCGTNMTQGGAWLQSDKFGWVGPNSLMDRHGCWSKAEDGGDFSDDDIGA